jgi:isoquinoline 1-oxidoreductase alpha subunit
MPTISFDANGVRRTLDVPLDVPLLWLLRDHLGLTGTKFGCGQGICGSCTVLLAGEPVRACQVPASAAAGRAVVTIEGLSAGGDHPCQRAWIDEDVAQCGYCQPGMIVEAAALLARKPRPTDADVEAALDGHVCRCGTWTRIRRAVRRASELAARQSAPTEAGR